MENAAAVPRLAALLYRLRRERGISLLQLADEAGVSVSVVHGAELERDARLSTWEKLFAGLGYRLEFEAMEEAEEIADLLAEEADRREERRRDGLGADRRRFY
jgi:transcriptional regulator with XRE-family HTH domain